MSVFADEWEEKAHSVICLIKYNGVGGSVDKNLLRKVGDHLRGYSLKPKLPTLPRIAPALPPLPPVLPQLPTLNGPVPSLPLPPLPK